MEITGTNNDGFYTYVREGVADRKSEFDTSLFMKLLSTQLQHQDPFEPMKNSELYDNISKMANVDSTDKMNKQLTQLVQSFNTMNAAGMLGKNIVATDPATGNLVSGKVNKVFNRDGEMIFSLKDTISGLNVEVSPSTVKELS